MTTAQSDPLRTYEPISTDRARGNLRASVDFQTIAPGHDFKFAAPRVLDRNNRPRLEFESREHGTELVHGDRIVAIRQHVAAPVAYPDNEQLDLEVGGRFPTAKYVKDPLLTILILDGRPL